MEVADLDDRELEHLLWDRVLHRDLRLSGKRLIVDKTPTNVLRWRPRARYIFLLRHPLRIVESAVTARPHATARSPPSLSGCS